MHKKKDYLYQLDLMPNLINSQKTNSRHEIIKIDKSISILSSVKDFGNELKFKKEFVL